MSAGLGLHIFAFSFSWWNFGTGTGYWNFLSRNSEWDFGGSWNRDRLHGKQGDSSSDGPDGPARNDNTWPRDLT